MEGVSIEPEDELVSCSQSCFMLKIRFFMLMWRFFFTSNVFGLKVPSFQNINNIFDLLRLLKFWGEIQNPFDNNFKQTSNKLIFDPPNWPYL